jgi:hypothetical protein
VVVAGVVCGTGFVVGVDTALDGLFWCGLHEEGPFLGGWLRVVVSHISRPKDRLEIWGTRGLWWNDRAKEKPAGFVAGGRLFFWLI